MSGNSVMNKRKKNTEAAGESPAAVTARTNRTAAGGGSPRALTGGEEKLREAKIDWLNFTWGLLIDKRQLTKTGMCNEILRWLKVWFSCDVAFEHAQGLHGFENSVRYYGIKDGNVQLIAIVAWGGASQKGRAYLELTGTGCTVVKDWKLVTKTIEHLPLLKITRLDLCVDFFDGEYTPIQARDDFGEGLFQFARRMPPKAWENGDWTYHTGQGRTFYVGKRENGKQARIYEKGKQLGCPHDPWVRFEVELHSRDREIPLESLTNPTQYFAGCFPICQQITGISGVTLHTFQEEFTISLDRLIDYCKLSYGKLFNVCQKVGMPMEAVFKLLLSDGVPARLAKSDWQSSTWVPESPTLSGA